MLKLFTSTSYATKYGYKILKGEDALGINSAELTRVGKRLAKAIKLMTGYEIEVGGSRYVSIPGSLLHGDILYVIQAITNDHVAVDISGVLLEDKTLDAIEVLSPLYNLAFIVGKPQHFKADYLYINGEPAEHPDAFKELNKLVKLPLLDFEQCLKSRAINDNEVRQKVEKIFNIVTDSSMIAKMIALADLGIAPLNAVASTIEENVDCSDIITRQYTGRIIKYVLGKFGYEMEQDNRDNLRNFSKAKMFKLGVTYKKTGKAELVLEYNVKRR